MRPLIIARGADAAPDNPFKTRQSVPVGLDSFDAIGADSVGAQRRLEAGKNGSHPSCLLAGMEKTDFGTVLLDVTVLATGAASAVAAEYVKARVAIVTQVKKEVFMGC